MDRFDAMATLVATVDGGSLSAASRALGMPLATVSRKISELESLLRTQLVVRTSRKLVLTEAGQAYVAASRRILDEIEDAERAASGEYRAPRGHLTITASVMFGRLHVEPVVLEFLKAYPDINARLVLADHVVNLVDDQVDVAIRVGLLPDSRMIATRLGEVGWVTCASPQYLEANGTPETPAELEKHDCIMFEGVYSNNLWSFGRGKESIFLPVRPRFSVNTADAAIAAAMASAGITHVLSYQVADAVASGALRLILRPFEPKLLPVHIIYAGQSLMPLKLRAFLDFSAPRLKASIPEFGLPVHVG
ncbi:LysR family transcriptional regulator [Bradyrhizobium sp. AUGA SZCCT0283]|uniref:LysR family transcriptional regulator n=1 Tax=Bradyrhizobium sp. AUGA SZCCT0283 TaxID=2807671 RepID=UPI001BAAF091|nr:LysR family transcriptional regulator [Bradyrhizobium sp. AUGA SZCCT0283]MBR1275955.1 LysR family transcriptional regulator [Bradyrhizobium sp. AUGA SZCCT0283]